MEVRQVISHDSITTNTNKVALEYGPIVYCLEGIDNNGQVFETELKESDEFTVEYDENLLYGINTIKAKDSGIMAIPYFAWANRDLTDMEIWIKSVK